MIGAIVLVLIGIGLGAYSVNVKSNGTFAVLLILSIAFIVAGGVVAAKTGTVPS